MLIADVAFRQISDSFSADSSRARRQSSQFELAIFEVAQRVESQCNALDGEGPSPFVLDGDSKSVPLSESVVKSVPLKKGKKRRKPKTKSLALREMRRKYEENASNIDQVHSRKVSMLKKRKSFHRVALDQNIKTAAVSGFRRRAKADGAKKGKKDLMKELFADEASAITECSRIVHELGFLKMLCDYALYSRSAVPAASGSTGAGSRRKNRKRSNSKRKRKESQNGTDSITMTAATVPVPSYRQRSVSSVDSMRRESRRQSRKSVKVLDVVMEQSANLEVDEEANKENVNGNSNAVRKQKKTKRKKRGKMRGKIGAKFGHLQIDPLRMKVGAAPPKPRRMSDVGRLSGIDHSALMDKVMVKGRRKRTRKRVVFDAEGNILRDHDHQNDNGKDDESNGLYKDQQSLFRDTASATAENEENVENYKNSAASEVTVDSENDSDGARDTTTKPMHCAVHTDPEGFIADKMPMTVPLKGGAHSAEDLAPLVSTTVSAPLPTAAESAEIEEKAKGTVYDQEVLDMTNSNIMLTLPTDKVSILQNVVCAALQQMETLQVIEACNCGLDDVFLGKICKALCGSDLCNIWCFNIQSNPIGDAGMLSLCSLLQRNHRSLTHIKLQNNRKDISTAVCEQVCDSLQENEWIKVFEFEFRHHQYRDKCKKVLWRNNENARKMRRKKRAQ